MIDSGTGNYRNKKGPSGDGFGPGTEGELGRIGNPPRPQDFVSDDHGHELENIMGRQPRFEEPKKKPGRRKPKTRRRRRKAPQVSFAELASQLDAPIGQLPAIPDAPGLPDIPEPPPFRGLR